MCCSGTYRFAHGTTYTVREIARVAAVVGVASVAVRVSTEQSNARMHESEQDCERQVSFILSDNTAAMCGSGTYRCADGKTYAVRLTWRLFQLTEQQLCQTEQCVCTRRSTV